MSGNRTSHIRITSHPGTGATNRFPIAWDAPTARERGPVVATANSGSDRNAIGAHGGAYSVYRALAVASGAMDPMVRPELVNTHPVVPVGPHPQWSETGKIVSLDPWGARIAEDFAGEIAEGVDIRPTIAVTKARITLPEIAEAIRAGRLKPDGKVLHETGDVAVTKAAIDPVWHLPGVAARLALAGVVDQELGHFAQRAAFFAVVGDQARAAVLGLQHRLLDAVGQVGAAGADVGAEHVGAVAFVVNPHRQRLL